jgi:hypothetical protein
MGSNTYGESPGSLLRYHIKNGTGKARGKWTYSEIAEAIKCSPDSVGKWVRNKSTINKWTAEALANAFQMRGYEKRSLVHKLNMGGRIELANINGLCVESTIEDIFYSEVFSAISYFGVSNRLALSRSSSIIESHFSKYDLPVLDKHPVSNILSIFGSAEIENPLSIKRTLDSERIPPIRVGVSPANAASLCILKFIQNDLGVPIDISHDVLTSVDLVKDIHKGSFTHNIDAMILSLGSSINLYMQDEGDYIPVCAMPGFSVGISTNSNNIDSRDLSYLYSSYPISGSCLIHREFGSVGTVVDSTPKKAILDSLTGDGSASILGFPYWNILQKVSGVRVLNRPSEGIHPSLLFLRRDLYENRCVCECLINAIFYACILMGMNSCTLEAQIKSVIDKNYLRNVKNTMGIFL